MTRIVGGALGGRRLSVPAGRGTRPTSDRAREGLFSTLEAIRGSLDGARVLDLFAGSGAVGLEAASRGAGHVVLVERDTRAVGVIRRNIEALGTSVVDLRSGSVDAFLAQPAGQPFDVVFVDPPYADPVDGVLSALVGNDWLTERAVVVVERDSKDGDLSWPEEIVADRSRRYGDSTLWYGRRP